MRKAVAILVGFMIWTLMWLGGNAAINGASPEHFDEAGVTTHSGILVGILVLSVVASLVAGVSQASLSRTNVMKSGMILGAVLLVVGIAVQAQYWSAMPVWYHLVFLALLLPMTLIGSSLRAGRG